MARRFPPIKQLGRILFLLLLLVVLTYKVIDEGWFVPRTPLELGGKPALLFFNRHKGCECALVVYRAAAKQVDDWTDEQRQGIQLIHIDLDRRPDLGAQYGVIRAPTILLVDQTGTVVYRQDEVVTDAQPLDLPLAAQKIEEVLNGN